MIDNDTAHDICLLQLPDYTLEAHVDNTGLHSAIEKVLVADGETQLGFYHANMAALIPLARWFDFMKQQGVYGNTRIILVADHGNKNSLTGLPPMLFYDSEIDVQQYNPLLLVKDFDSTEGFAVSHEFMTIADVPALAADGIIPHPQNPFTGKELSREHSVEAKKQPQLVTGSEHHSPLPEEYVFDTDDSKWFSVHDDIFKEENWEIAR